ncbi:MAG: transposase [Geodermatophilaceae bacterium]
MGSTRRRFTDEYKSEAVAFVIDDGRRPIAEIARNIGVHEMTLGKWVKKAPTRVQRGAGEAIERVRTRGTRASAGRECATTHGCCFRKKSSDLVREAKAVKFAAIANWADQELFTVAYMCDQLARNLFQLIGPVRGPVTSPGAARWRCSRGQRRVGRIRR